MIGGTSLFGGRGRIYDAVTGGLVVAIIANGLPLVTREVRRAVHHQRPRAPARRQRRRDLPQKGGRNRQMIRWGILSTARIAQRIVEGARLSENAQIVAVGSRDLDASPGLRVRARDRRASTGPTRTLLADPEVDAVYIPLPNSMHVPWSVKALEAGKHVLCEKPLSRDPAQVDAAFDAAERAGRVLMEAFMWRFHPQTDELVRLVRSGAVGERAGRAHGVRLRRHPSRATSACSRRSRAAR